MSDHETPVAENDAAAEETLPALSTNAYLTPEEALTNAPNDIVEDDVEGVFGGKVRIRSLTAAQQARVKQVSLNLSGRNPDVAWAEMERTQFQLGVIEPKFTAEQVLMLHRMSGPSFAKVIERIDEISGTNKEELRKAQQEFQGPEE